MHCQRKEAKRILENCTPDQIRVYRHLAGYNSLVTLNLEDNEVMEIKIREEVANIEVNQTEKKLKDLKNFATATATEEEIRGEEDVFLEKKKSLNAATDALVDRIDIIERIKGDQINIQAVAALRAEIARTRVTRTCDDF